MKEAINILILEYLRQNVEFEKYKVAYIIIYFWLENNHLTLFKFKLDVLHLRCRFRNLQLNIVKTLVFGKDFGIIKRYFSRFLEKFCLDIAQLKRAWHRFVFKVNSFQFFVKIGYFHILYHICY